MNNELSPEQQTAIINTKEVLASKQEVLMAIGQVQAFDFVQKLVTVTELKLVQQIKESKSYKGLAYKNENEELVTVTTWEDCCKYLLKTSREQLDAKLLNLQTFGEEFFEASQNMGLGYRELRKLRQLPSDEQALIINSEAVDLGDKEAVKELIEDYTFQHVTEKAELQKQVDEAKQNEAAIRDIAQSKQQELDQLKEIEAKRRFSQTPWKHQTLDLVKGMLEARAQIEQGINQLHDIFQQITDPESSLDEKAAHYCARSMLSESINVSELVMPFTTDVTGLLSGTFKPDIDAVEVLQELSDSDE